MRRARSRASLLPSTATSRAFKAKCVPLSAAGKIDTAPAAPAAPVVVAPAKRLSDSEIRYGGQSILAAASGRRPRARNKSDDERERPSTAPRPAIFCGQPPETPYRRQRSGA